MPSDYHRSRMNAHGVLHPVPAPAKPRPKRDTCPVCGGQWAETGADGKTYHNMLCGQVENDRVASWWCMHCRTSWKRGDPAIYQEAGDG